MLIGRYGPPIFQILRGKSGSYNVALIKAEPKDFPLERLHEYFLKREDLFHMIDSCPNEHQDKQG